MLVADTVTWRRRWWDG